MTFVRAAFSIVIPLASAGMVLGAISGTGCGSSDDGGDGSADSAAQNAEALFRQIEPSLVNRCGAKDGICHIKGVYNDAPKWLAEPDRYASMKGFRGILPITKDADDSTILTQAAHDGPSLDATPDLKAKVREWVLAEIGTQKLPSTKRFTLQAGGNVIDLKDVDPALAGATLEITAGEGRSEERGLRGEVGRPRRHAKRLFRPRARVAQRHTGHGFQAGFYESIDIPWQSAEPRLHGARAFP
jgi:hypothetical protein